MEKGLLEYYLMECPVCYVDFNNTDSKPKVAECGHSLCSTCINKMDSCPLCKRPFHDQSYPVHPAHPMMESLNYRRAGPLPDLYAHNLRLPRRRTGVDSFKDNYALLELIEKNSKKYGLCQVSKAYEELYCMNCRTAVCIPCIDRDHTDHSLRRLSLSMYQFSKGIEEVGGLLGSVDETIDQYAKNVRVLNYCNAEMEEGIPRSIVNITNEMIRTIVAARDYLLNEFEENSIKAKENLENLTKSSNSQEAESNILRVSLSEMLETAKDSNFKEDLELISKLDQTKILAQTLFRECGVSLDNTGDDKAVKLQDKTPELRKILAYLKDELPRKSNEPNNPFVTCGDSSFQSPMFMGEVNESFPGCFYDADQPADRQEERQSISRGSSRAPSIADISVALRGILPIFRGIYQAQPRNEHGSLVISSDNYSVTERNALDQSLPSNRSMRDIHDSLISRASYGLNSRNESTIENGDDPSLFLVPNLRGREVDPEVRLQRLRRLLVSEINPARDEWEIPAARRVMSEERTISPEQSRLEEEDSEQDMTRGFLHGLSTNNEESMALPVRFSSLNRNYAHDL